MIYKLEVNGVQFCLIELRRVDWCGLNDNRDKVTFTRREKHGECILGGKVCKLKVKTQGGHFFFLTLMSSLICSFWIKW